jgi:hypothetical protein
MVASLGISWELAVEFCTGDCEDRTWAREVDESSLLEAVAREGLMKTLQAGEDLVVAEAIYEVWRLAVALYCL